MSQSNKPTEPTTTSEGELSEEQLDAVAGGQEVVKLGKITVTGKREEGQQVVNLGKITVTGKREEPTQVASTTPKTKPN